MARSKHSAGADLRRKPRDERTLFSILRRVGSDRGNRVLVVLTVVLSLAWLVPFESPRVSAALHEAFLMLSEYAREHVLLCLVPAFFIAGAIMVFLDQRAIIRYLGPNASRIVAYSVASVSGAVLAVCSCTVLPIFKGIHKKGAGIGPAVAFLYSGPAINILAIVLTAKVLGLRLGAARAVGAVVFALVIGAAMHLLFRREDEARATDASLFENHGVLLAGLRLPVADVERRWKYNKDAARVPGRSAGIAQRFLISLCTLV